MSAPFRCLQLGRRMTDEGKKSSVQVKSAFKFTYSRIRGKRFAQMFAAAMLMLAVGAIMTIPPHLLGQIVSKATSGKQVTGYDIFPEIRAIKTFSDIWPYVAFLVILILIREALILVRKYLVEKVATDIEAKEYAHLSSHLLSLDIQGSKELRSGLVNQQFGRGITGLIQLIKLT